MVKNSVLPPLQKGQKVRLDVNDSARRRIACGLNWNTMSDSATSAAPRGTARQAQDLDLICIVFDKYGRFLEGVTGDHGQRTGGQGTIYHTGDVLDNAEDLKDNEQVSIELFNLPSKAHQIFFLVEIHTGQVFGEVKEPEIRIANAIDDKNMVQHEIGRTDGMKENAYVFGSVYRDGASWMFKFIDEYYNTAEITDWSETLKGFAQTDEIPPEQQLANSNMAKGLPVPLQYTEKARHRVICGLSWDPMEDTATLGDRLTKQTKGHNVDTHDLDLACIMFNEMGEPVDGVSGRPDETIDQSGRIYHTGDDEGGVGGGDDEAISVELKDMPDYISHIIFLVEIQSAHKFADVIRPEIRLFDAMNNREQLISRIGRSAKGADMDSYVFARLYKKHDKWMLQFIDEYMHGGEVVDWFETLRKYLK